MTSERKIEAIARLASTHQAGTSSILSLAAASYGARPALDDATMPTGFDVNAVRLFESIIEAAFLVAFADGVFDDEERGAFERIVTLACGGSVPQRQIEELVTDLSAQLDRDGIDARLQVVCAPLRRPEHSLEVLRVASLVAQVSEGVHERERAVLQKIAAAAGLGESTVDATLEEAAVQLRSKT